MPKEMFNPSEYNEKVKPFLRGPLKLLKTIEATISHSTFLYWIPPTDPGDDRSCDDCPDKAEFMLYDRDHRGNMSANLSCRKHSHKSFVDKLNDADW